MEFYFLPAVEFLFGSLFCFSTRFAQKHLTGGSVADQTIIACAEELLKAYELLSSEAFRPEAMNDHCTRFCLLYGSLEQRDACLWIVKPKFHQFQEIAQSGSNPSKTWCYTEKKTLEDFWHKPPEGEED